ncbi:hypothetical protein FOCC_FOCC005000 [Frankliniella occidentalis]|nr:hypothetical protein FOCC_FOCC005000 [Frankliniella occidentalis]
MHPVQLPLRQHDLSGPSACQRHEVHRDGECGHGPWARTVCLDSSPLGKMNNENLPWGGSLTRRKLLGFVAYGLFRGILLPFRLFLAYFGLLQGISRYFAAFLRYFATILPPFSCLFPVCFAFLSGHFGGICTSYFASDFPFVP